MSNEALKDLQRQIEKLSGSISKLSGESKVMLFAEFAASYLAAKLLNPTLRKSTKDAFSNQVKMHLIPAFGLLPIGKISNTVWLQWVTEAKGITRFFNARKALMEILIAAQAEGHIEKIPKLDNPDEVRNTGRALEEREILSILWHCRRPFRFIFYVFWKMGCRPQEILRWEWSMISFNEPGHTWIDIPARITKTDRTRKIPLNPDVSSQLFLRQLRGKASPFVFPSRNDPQRPQLSYQSAWGRACRLAGVSCVPYDLRRSFITRCAAEGKPLIYVAKALDTSVKLIESVYAKVQVDVMEGIIR